MRMAVHVWRNRHFDLPENPRGNHLRNSGFEEHYKKYGICLAQILASGDCAAIYRAFTTEQNGATRYQGSESTQ